MAAPVPFVVLVPVKPPSRGKSRLGVLPDDRRTALALAFARDTIEAALQATRVAHVLVVTDDHVFAAEAMAQGCAVVPDGVAGSLNGTLVQAAAEARRRWPSYGVAALCADLPALTPTDLDRGLALVEGAEPCFVADHVGTGTTMYAVLPGVQFAPRFGLDSRADHLDAGCRELPGELGTLRLDVDDLDDLAATAVAGLGRHTAAVYADTR